MGGSRLPSTASENAPELSMKDSPSRRGWSVWSGLRLLLSSEEPSLIWAPGSSERIAPKAGLVSAVTFPTARGRFPRSLIPTSAG